MLSIQAKSTVLIAHSVRFIFPGFLKNPVIFLEPPIIDASDSDSSDSSDSEI